MTDHGRNVFVNNSRSGNGRKEGAGATQLVAGGQWGNEADNVVVFLALFFFPFFSFSQIRALKKTGP